MVSNLRSRFSGALADGRDVIMMLSRCKSLARKQAMLLLFVRFWDTLFRLLRRNRVLLLLVFNAQDSA